MEGKRIGIIHLNQIGDLVFSLPLLKAVKEAYPGSTLHSILRPHLKDLLIHSPYVDEVIDRKKGMSNLLGLVKRIRREAYDLLISLSNSSECLFLSLMSGAGVKAGFRHFPWDLALDIREEVEGHHSWFNNAKLLKRLNIDIRKPDYVGLLALPERDESAQAPGSFPSMPQGDYSVISPGASARRRVKAWGEAKFGELLILLREKYHLTPVLVGGKEDREEADKIIEAAGGRNPRGNTSAVVNLAGRTGLRELCYVLRSARLFVGVDSGIMHLASSLDVPVVGIFGPSDPFYVGPQNKRSRVVREDLECVPCYLKGCEKRECMTRLDVLKVFEACEGVLKS